ncbi:NAD(P)H-dependent amine dehydrogenase family protein [Nocardia sp. NPDC003482]
MRVIQWTTGKVGKLSLRGILDDPRLELAGVYAYSADKAGVDAGTLCGRPETGVVATTDIDALLALGADTVVYTPFMADLDHVTRLLASGLDVISTNLFLNVGGIQGDTERRLAEACARGDSSLHITGINPGWVNAVVTALTAVCRDVRSVSIAESADVSVYESAETWGALGIGRAAATPELVEIAKLWMSTFRDSVRRMGVALGFDLDDLEFSVEYATAAETVDLGWLRIEQDTIAALRSTWHGKFHGRTVIRSNVAWYLTKRLNENWVFDDDHYRITIEGEPDVHTRIRFVPPDTWGNHEWDTMTAMPAVSSVFDVARAPAGILTLAEAGLPHAPAGLWAAHREAASTR